MKTLNLKTNFAGLLGMLVLALSGCGSSNNNGTAAISPYGASGYCAPGYASCANTGLYGTSTGLNQSNGLLARAAGFDGSQTMELALQFVGQAGYSTGVPYTGPYAVQGYFVVSQTMCGLPPGTYQLQSVSQSGSWNAGTNLSLQMIASGPGGQLQMILQNGFVSGRQGGAVTGPDGQPYENYVAGSLIIQGYQCGSITFGI